MNSRLDLSASPPSPTPLFEDYAQKHPFILKPDPRPGLEDLLTHSAGTFLEIGCGDGVRIEQLVRDGRLTTYSPLYASDISATRVTRTLQRVPLAKPIVSPGESIPLPDNSVDFIFSDQVIEHVPDDSAMAKEIYRLLRPNGVAYIGSVIKLPGAWYFRRNQGQWRLDETHVREYPSIESYTSVFTQAGLRITRTHAPQLALHVSAVIVSYLAKHPRNKLIAKCADLLHTVTIPIPRYRLCFAEMTKPAISPA